jgi:hypothetical protein
MRTVYRILAYLVAVEVALQAAVMVWAIAGLYLWVDEGGVLDAAVLESDDAPFDEVVGFMIHGINGMMVVPAIALILLIVSFFAKIKGGVRYAVIILVLVVLQLFLGLWGHEAAIFGLLHGLNAFAVYGAAFMAGHRASMHASSPEPMAGNASQ